MRFNAETPVAFRTARPSSGRIVPRATITRVTPFIPRERPNGEHYCRLFKTTTAYASVCTDAGAALAPLLSGGTRVRHWQSARRLWPDTRRLQRPLNFCCRLCRTMPCRQNRSLLTLRGWGQKVLLLAIIPVPRMNEWIIHLDSSLAVYRTTNQS